jgi:hypothetical protein
MIHPETSAATGGEIEFHPEAARTTSRASVALGGAIALLAALALSFSFIVDCFAEDAAQAEPLLVLADSGVRPESAGPDFRSAPEPQQIELLRRLLGVPSPNAAPPAAAVPAAVPAVAEPRDYAPARSKPVRRAERPKREAPATAGQPAPPSPEPPPPASRPPSAGQAPVASVPSTPETPGTATTTALPRFDQVLAVSATDLPAAGTSITTRSADRWDHLLVPAMRWAVRRGVPIDVVDAKAIVMEPARSEATERYHAQVELAPDGKRLRNYVAGIPFPHVTADDAHAAARLIFNAEKRILFDDIDGRNFGCRTGAIDAGAGLHVERDYRAAHFRRLYYSGRLLVDPKPVWNTGEGIHYRESISPFTEPFDYKGAGVTYTRYADASRPDDSWLYYPQSRRVRRLGTAQRSDGLFGLDIDLDSYGGFAGNPVWFDWELLGKKTLLSPFHPRHQPVRWADKPGDFLFHDDWEARETWVIAARSRVAGYNFSLRVIYVDAQSMLIPYTEVYDKDGQLWRAYVQQWKAGVDRSMPYTPAPAFRSPTSVVAGLSVFDIQQSHATLCEIPAADAPREEAWHLWEAENGGSVPEDFDLAAFITAGR